MAYDTTEDQNLIISTARRFAKESLAPNAMAWEEAGTLDRDTLPRHGRLATQQNLPRSY